MQPSAWGIITNWPTSVVLGGKIFMMMAPIWTAFICWIDGRFGSEIYYVIFNDIVNQVTQMGCFFSHYIMRGKRSCQGIWYGVWCGHKWRRKEIWSQGHTQPEADYGSSSVMKRVYRGLWSIWYTPPPTCYASHLKWVESWELFQEIITKPMHQMRRKRGSRGIWYLGGFLFQIMEIVNLVIWGVSFTCPCMVPATLRWNLLEE